jgi:hypothetical protein
MQSIFELYLKHQGANQEMTMGCVPPWTRQSRLVMLEAHLRLLPQLWMDPSMDWQFLSGLLAS